MIKFVINSDRFVEACTIREYMGVILGNVYYQNIALPKFAVDENGKYIVQVTQNEDGDPIKFENSEKADLVMESIGIKRFEKLRKELTEAARNIVNPPSGRDLKGQ